MEIKYNIDERLSISNTKGKYELAGSQASLEEKFKKVLKSKSLKKELVEIKKIIRRNHPEYTDNDIKNLAKEICQSGCTYVTCAGIILEQLNYNAEEFYKLFGFPMQNEKGEFNHDMLIAELYSFMKDKIELDIGGVEEVLTFDNNIEAAKAILGKDYSNESQTFIDIVKAGYRIDGKSYTRFLKKPKLLMGNYKEVGKKVLGENVNITSVTDLETLLKAQNISFHINYLNNNEKFSTLFPSNFDKWMNYYFKEKNIDMQIVTNKFRLHDYDNLVNDLREYLVSGASLSVGSDPGSIVNMTDGSKLGWFNFANIARAGHSMPFIGVTDKGDILVSSWGEKQMIPKEFCSLLNFYSRKLISRNKEFEEKDNKIVETTSYIENESQYIDVYRSINEKIEYINSKISASHEETVDATISLLSTQIFSQNELPLISFANTIFKDNMGNNKVLRVIAIQNGDDYYYKVFNQGNGFVDVSKEYFENLIVSGQLVDDGTIPGLSQLRR